MIRMIRALLVAVVLLSPFSAHAFDHHHTLWTEQLQRYVVWVRGGVASEVDYQAWRENPEPLHQYLQQLSGVSAAEYHQWTAAEQLAFLLNAYNAFTIELVLEHYPVSSIKKIGPWFSSPWRQKFFKLCGEIRSLEDVEHRMIRASAEFKDPRIHFALVCASVGCPALPREAFVGEKLDGQFQQAVERFLSDPQRNRFNPQDGTLEVSSIFKWYGEDFVGFREVTAVKDFFRPYASLLSADPLGQQLIRQAAAPLVFLPYDWRLNARH